MEQLENRLTTAPISLLIREIAVPASIGFFFNTMFNVVDTFYGGLVSTEALAALSLSFPIFFIIIALGTGISTGTSALVANSLGAKRNDEAGLIAAQSISFTILFSAILTLLGFLVSPKLFVLLGAEGQYLNSSIDYMNMIFIGTVFFMLVYIANASLNAMGNTKLFRNFLIAGFFLNLILNPIFMFGWLGLPALGLKGLALATIVIEALGVLYLGSHLIQTPLLKGRHFRDFVPRLGIIKMISAQALPASLNMFTVGLGIFIITYFISPFGKAAVAAYGIATRVEQIFLLPTIGLTIAALTLVGQNNGAGNIARVKESLKLTLKYGAYLMTLGAVLIFVFARQFMDIFTNDAEVIGAGIKYLRIVSVLTWAYAILFTNVSAMQGMKKPMFALWVGLSRQIVAPLIVFTMAAKLYGITGIWWGIVLINWSAAVISIVYVRNYFNKIIKAN